MNKIISFNKKHIKVIQSSLLALSFLFLIMPNQSNATFSFMDTGETLLDGNYRATTGIQSIFSDLDTLGFVGRFGMSLTPGTEAQAEISFGSHLLNFNTSVKWVPFPDVKSQPALGLKIGANFFNYKSTDIFSIHLTPFISKNFQSSIGPWTPYIAIPLVVPLKADTDIAVHGIAGANWLPRNIDPPISFFTEFGFNIENSFNHFLVGLSWEFQRNKKVSTPTLAPSEPIQSSPIVIEGQ